MDRVYRIDLAGGLATAARAGDGALVLSANVARTGVQTYNGVREYRAPEEVFSPASLASFEGLALTLGHPTAPVSPSNWRSVAVGHLAGVSEAGPFVRAKVVIHDAEAIAGIDAGTLVEMSVGYSCKTVIGAGVSPDGEPYDARQENIVANHVALLGYGEGRAGREVRLLGTRRDQANDAIAAVLERLAHLRERMANARSGLEIEVLQDLEREAEAELRAL